MVTTFYVVSIALAVATLLAATVRYTIKGIIWVSRALVLWEDVAAQFRPNHGSSLVDRFESLEREVQSIRASLVGSVDELASRRQDSV